MATYKDPARHFAFLEVVERLLEIRAESGYAPAIFLLSSEDLTIYFDAYGFDGYSLFNTKVESCLNEYRSRLAPSGDRVRASKTAH
jgi:hypothetical protein